MSKYLTALLADLVPYVLGFWLGSVVTEWAIKRKFSDDIETFVSEHE